MIGKNFGRYKIVERLGEGGMGQVFLADDPVLDRRVAIKLLAPEFTSDPDRRLRLQQEARAASSLNHPSILTIYDLGEQDGVIYVAMEWIDGRTLRDWARAEARATADVLAMIRQATRALALAHAAGLVHRDLKPANLMVRRDGLLKILDFGLARSSSGETDNTMTMPGALLGTAPYMSPEQVLGQPARAPSDVFSLSTVFYEMLTGTHPFAGGSAVDTMHKILHDTPPPPSKINPAVTSDIDFVVLKALSKEPERRYANAKDFDFDLDTCECACARTERPAGTKHTSPQTVAVLPFKNIGGNAELNYLGVGLADAVITRLSTSPDLVVRATSSIAPYENQAVDPRRVARELEVEAVLDASFQRAGERFRATARLVEAATGRALWAGKVDLGFDDIFEVQDQVAQGIAEALTARLTGAAGKERPRYTPSPEAYELYLRAQEASRASNREGFLRAADLAEAAVAADARYAQAWSFLGGSYLSMVDGGFDSDRSWLIKSEAALARALELEPDDGLAVFTKGQLDLIRGRKREAFRSMTEALRRMPNNWAVHHYLAYLFRLCDMTEEAIRCDTRAHEIDPGVPWPYWGLCRLHTLRREFEQAHAWIEKVRPRFGNLEQTAGWEVALLLAERRYEEAAELAEGMGTVDHFVAAINRSLSFIFAGRRDEAERVLQISRSYAEVDMDGAAYYAAAMGLMGDRDAAFHFLDRAVELGNDSLSFYGDDDFFGTLHEDPRWDPFITGVRRRVAEWRREFRAPD